MVYFWPYFATASDDQCFPMFSQSRWPQMVFCGDSNLASKCRWVPSPRSGYIHVYSTHHGSSSWGSLEKSLKHHETIGSQDGMSPVRLKNDMFLPFFRWSFSFFFCQFFLLYILCAKRHVSGVRSCPSNTEVMPGSVLGRPTHLMLSDDWNVLERKCLGIFGFNVFLCVLMAFFLGNFSILKDVTTFYD